ncbi:hypothetical protein UY286_19955 [Paenibacillus polymyxa]|uniref:Uncharacterized protein n=2 Tax=Paenibacillus polymyxa TaxID=1406 RepID=A0AAE9IFD5_PAEPO|nr:hypothetical protein [Paenibacillus polymyxa]MDY7993094.1 hypothetical protein [Paenibacillus polymyxa]MDY8119717.1 hypothetical protein [Paenibacillus polymyxa]URJ50996.1 hypothetical protein MF626_000385 [Paenibacillus polymyxa]
MKEELTYIQSGKYNYLDRTNITNMVYLCSCSALSFHKSLIGLSELRALESVKDVESAGGLRISRAVLTYYSVYHLFISLMLLDERFNLKVPKRLCSNGIVNLGVNFNDLSDPSELPNVWNEFKLLEQDLSTLITHTDVKEYCDCLREESEKLDEVFRILYNNFIFADENKPNESIKGLYEKLCYVRDRAIYRPSNVIDVEGGYIQTSKYVRKEIDELPDSAYIFDAIRKIYREILIKSNIKGRSMYKSFYSLLWVSHVFETVEEVKKLGITDSEIDKLRFMKSFNADELSFSSYISQLIELVNTNRLFSDLEDFWNELIRMSMEHYGTSEWHY